MADIRDQKLPAVFEAAQRSDDPFLRRGEALSGAATPWAWEGIILRGCLNLLVSMPKVGKTSLMLAMLRAWHQNDLTFLGRTLVGPCPPVLIIGTGMPSVDWSRMLGAVGWLLPGGILAGPLVGLVTRDRPLHLDPEGIDRIAEIAQQHPGLLILVDFLNACVGPLGLKEESAKIVKPISDLMEHVKAHRATVVLIHHSGKGRAAKGGASASRGSAALPAAASQVVAMRRLTLLPGEQRIRLTTDGRGGQAETLVIQQHDGNCWELLDGEGVGR